MVVDDEPAKCLGKSTQYTNTKMNDVQIVKAVRHWDGSVIDLNKIVRIGKPVLYRAGFGHMCKASLSVAIDIIDSRDSLIITTDITNETSSYDRNNPPNFTDVHEMRDIYWKCVDGKWKIHPVDDEIQCYIDFKCTVDKLIEIWGGDSQKVLEL